MILIFLVVGLSIASALGWSPGDAVYFLVFPFIWAMVFDILWYRRFRVLPKTKTKTMSDCVHVWDTLPGDEFPTCLKCGIIQPSRWYETSKDTKP